MRRRRAAPPAARLARADPAAFAAQLLTSIADYAEVNKVYEQAFGAHKPARAAFAVKELPANALVEIECVALEKSPAQ